MFNHKCHKSASWLVLGALTACQHAAQAPAISSPPAQAKLTAAPRAMVAPPVVVAPSVAPAAPVTTANASLFVDGVRLGYTARLWPLGKSALLSTDKLLLAVRDDSVAVDPALLEGLHPGSRQFSGIFGNSPDTVWAAEVSYAERTSRTNLSRWDGSQWLPVSAALEGKGLLAVAAWSGGRTLGLVEDEYAQKLGFIQLAGRPGAPLPQLPYTRHDELGCVHGIQPSAMSALPSGQVFLAGTLCRVDANDGTTLHGVVLERWEAGKTQGKVSILPALAETEATQGLISKIVAVSPHDVYAAGVRTPLVPEGQDAQDEAYLARYDGESWRVLKAPPLDGIDDLQRSSDGRLWALKGGDLWVMSSAASETANWEQVVMPEFAADAGEHAVSSLWVRDDGEVWASVGSEATSYLLRTKRGSQALSAPSADAVRELTAAVDPTSGDSCEAPTFLVLAIARQAPKDLDFPSVRQALRGHDELAGKVDLIDFSLLNRRYLGLRGEHDAMLQAEQVLSNAGVPGIRYDHRCIKPEAARTLSVDFSGPKLEQPATHHLKASRGLGSISRRTPGLVDFE